MNWELWTDCCQISDGCANLATDFSLLKAGEWRGEAWAMIRERTDNNFLILIKRIDRFPVYFPDDWSEGYDNMNIRAQGVKAGVTFWFKNTGSRVRHDGSLPKSRTIIFTGRMSGYKITVNVPTGITPTIWRS